MKPIYVCKRMISSWNQRIDKKNDILAVRYIINGILVLFAIISLILTLKYWKSVDKIFSIESILCLLIFAFYGWFLIREPLVRQKKLLRHEQMLSIEEYEYKVEFYENYFVEYAYNCQRIIFYKNIHSVTCKENDIVITYYSHEKLPIQLVDDLGTNSIKICVDRDCSVPASELCLFIKHKKAGGVWNETISIMEHESFYGN